MPGPSAIEELVGRQQVLARIVDLLARALNGQRVTVLVSGEAGIGKTSLLRAVVAEATEQGAQTGWGTSVDVDGAPGHWPWTQVLNGLVRGIGAEQARRLADDDAPLLATIVPSLGQASRVEATDRARLLLLDATARFLDALASERPLVVVLDDLQWADESSLALFDFVARAPHRSGVCLIGAYRHDELNDSRRERLSRLITHSHHLHLQGLATDAVHELIERLLGRPVDRSMAEAIHRRTGGHPLFVRELALLTHHDQGTVERVPSAVRDLIEHRIGRLPGATRDVLQVTAVSGNELLTDVVASALGISTLAVEAAARDAVDSGVLAATGDGLHFTHDLLREGILDQLEASRRVALHQSIGLALEDRMARAGDVAPAELARHFIGAIPVEGPHRAARWALAAAAADCGALAFLEAAAHLRRLRAALADGAVDVEDNLRFEV
ncbi:MAG TPA: AAA family ATPase, partial [Acidimicrobiales bacterium]|nr:AAA family ATPase [Acidimicrobiales bacterium]